MRVKTNDMQLLNRALAEKISMQDELMKANLNHSAGSGPEQAEGMGVTRRAHEGQREDAKGSELD